jgi:hypothetical protein
MKPGTESWLKLVGHLPEADDHECSRDEGYGSNIIFNNRIVRFSHNQAK